MNTDALKPLKARWAALAPRERRAASLAGWICALGLLWSLAISPALRTLQTAGAQKATLDRQLQQMQALQNEAGSLLAQPRLGGTDAVRALEISVKQRLGEAAQLKITGDRATLTLKGVAADDLAQWLAQSRVNARALPIEARLNRSPDAAATSGAAALQARSARWDGTVVLRLP